MNADADKKRPPGPPPLPLSQTENGALATAPLSTVINSATDALYQDLYTLVHGDVKIVSVASNAAGGGAAEGGGDGGGGQDGGGGGGGGGGGAAASVEEKLTAAALGVGNSNISEPSPGVTAAAASSSSANNNNNSNPNDAAVLETRKQRMANLSFAQRRHELTRRVVQHTKSIAHAYALSAASLPKSHSSILRQKAQLRNTSSAHGAARGAHDDPPPRLGATAQVSSDALQFVKSGWVSQDEAQDALYFHHDGLWKARAHCHDVLGALCVLSTPGGGEGKERGGAGGDGVHAGADAMQVDDEPSSSNGDRDDNGTGGGGGRWPDFPMDVALAVDRYETSEEKAYSESELRARLASAVRRKLVLGEVGAYGALGGGNGGARRDGPARTILGGSERDEELPWRVVMGRGGGSIRLTHGAPRTASTAEALRQRSLADDDSDGDAGDMLQYPMEARLSVLSESSTAPWKLLSVRVRCSPKTGESDHQLALNRKQMFDLHRIGDRCMIVEEAICRKKAENGGLKARDAVVPRPLRHLFEVTHAFALSLQMEILSSQAEALRRGAWGGSAVGSGKGARRDAPGECIAVSPAYFFEGTEGERSVTGGGDDRQHRAPIAVMAVHFWSCDDRHGSPRVGDLAAISADKSYNGTKRDNNDDESSSMMSSKATNRTHRRDDNCLPMSDRRGDKRLSLCVRAVPTVGLVVSLSGGSDMGADDSDTTREASHHMRRNVDKLLSSVQDPFQLSMSDALLAATVLCADRRCRAVVTALNRKRADGGGLPPWIRLEAECGTISVAAVVSYPTSAAAPSTEEGRSPAILFRLACDSRTGRFVPVFPRPASLLRLLACNDPSASDIGALRSAALARHRRGDNATRRATNGGAASRESTGRIVRDGFEALARSADTLGRRCGVGGDWNDVDVRSSASLRERSVDGTCRDVRASLMTCCGMATAFGVGAIALRIAGGIDPVVDMAGGPIVDAVSYSDLIRVPPLSVPLRQRIVEKLTREGDGETKRTSQLEGELFAVSARVNDDSLALVCFDVLAVSESASSVPTRLEYAEVNSPESDKVTSEAADDHVLRRPSKKPRAAKEDMGSEGSKYHHTLEEVEHATLWLDTLLQQQ